MNKENLDKKLAKWEANAKTCIKWLAVDANGEVFGYNTKPNVERLAGWWGGDRYSIILGITDDEDLRKNWDKTLRKVNYEQ